MPAVMPFVERSKLIHPPDLKAGSFSRIPCQCSSLGRNSKGRFKSQRSMTFLASLPVSERKRKAPTQ
jgi:hypothetical protein